MPGFQPFAALRRGPRQPRPRAASAREPPESVEEVLERGPGRRSRPQEVAVVCDITHEEARERLGHVAVEQHVGFDGFWTLPGRRPAALASARQRAASSCREAISTSASSSGPRPRTDRSATATTRTPSARAHAMSRGVSPITTVRSRGHGAAVQRAGARARDRRQVGAVSRVGAEAALARRRRAADPGARELQPRDGSRLPVTSESRIASAARSSASSASSTPGATCAERSSGTSSRVAPTSASRERRRSALVDRAPRRRRRAAGCRARSPGRCAHRSRRARRAGRRPRPRAIASCSAQRVLVGARGSAACRRCRTGAAARGAQRSKRDVRRQPLGERGDQLRRVLDVVELHHLDRRVHVAQRDRDEAGRDAAARDVDRVGVGAGAARRGRQR